jgi:hypothetical protein
MQDNPKFEMNRRQLLTSLGLLGGMPVSPLMHRAFAAAPPSNTVRDRLWLWSHVAGSYNGMYNLPAKSRMTPAEAAFYMSIPNVFMIHLNNEPAPPLEQYALVFEPLREVVWGIVRPGGETNEAEREMVLKLVLENPKITGVVMDDFFRLTKAGAGRGKDGAVSNLSDDNLRAMKKRLNGPAKKLDLWVVLYEFQLFPSVVDQLKLCDVLQLWTWDGEQLGKLEPYIQKVEKMVPGARLSLGLYWWDFGNKKPLTMAAMQQQCELGLEWLRKGRIEAMIFCGSWLCDRGLETVDWTRQWIKKVGGQKVPKLRPR